MFVNVHVGCSLEHVANFDINESLSPLCQRLVMNGIFQISKLMFEHYMFQDCVLQKNLRQSCQYFQFHGMISTGQNIEPYL